MDMIYALLLADKQWGSQGTYNYKQIAQTMLGSLFTKNQSIIEKATDNTFWIKIGDWAKNYGEEDYFINITRPSDWLLYNLRSFAAVSSGQTSVDLTMTIDNTYNKLFYMVENYSNTSGLMPDFITGYPEDTTKTMGPAYKGWWKKHDKSSSMDYLEGKADGLYYYNACRYPWRVGADVILYDTISEAAVKDRLVKIAELFKSTAPGQVWDGYYLDGTKIPKSAMPSPDDGVFGKKCFVSPLAVAFLATNGYQGRNYTSQLQSYWDYMAQEPDSNQKYYSRSINLLNMILISGNWWNPEQ